MKSRRCMEDSEVDVFSAIRRIQNLFQSIRQYPAAAFVSHDASINLNANHVQNVDLILSAGSTSTSCLIVIQE